MTGISAQLTCLGYSKYENNYMKNNSESISDFIRSQIDLFSTSTDFKKEDLSKNFDMSFSELTDPQSEKLKLDIINSVIRALDS
ncbi:MAG: hypothetical protein K1060chlam2_01321 [Chlamydiae bacterium]|nr:hypothetical protein [Chlamydiota bacterium]